jgi:glycerol kinase
VVYDAAGQARGTASQELTQHYPRPGWVEHDAGPDLLGVGQVVQAALSLAGIEGNALAGIGVSNQRETAVLWQRDSGKPAARAIVWQDRRTADFCKAHQADEPWLFQRTGLVLDPYFSATKWRWLLEQDAALRKQAEDGKLAAGTIDSFLIWRLTAGTAHVTDRTNASRTLLARLDTASWDEELCRYFAVPSAVLPEIRPSMGEFGVTAKLGFLPDGIPIRGVAGDQQAALFGQCAFAPGEAKCTYGTGAFFLQHLGTNAALSRYRLLTTVAASGAGPLQYALEGAVFIAGAAVQWLRDGLELFDAAHAVEGMAARSDPEQPVLFVPGFVGLGAPHWVPDARGVLFGLTRNTTRADISRATLEGVAYQVADLIDAAGRDAGQRLAALRVDGGMARNAWFLQCQADVLGLPVDQSATSEATALGAAYLAGLSVGVWPDTDALRRLAKPAQTFTPRLPADLREQRLDRWRRAVQAVIGFYKG